MHDIQFYLGSITAQLPPASFAGFVVLDCLQRDLSDLVNNNFHIHVDPEAKSGGMNVNNSDKILKYLSPKAVNNLSRYLEKSINLS